MHNVMIKAYSSVNSRQLKIQDYRTPKSEYNRKNRINLKIKVLCFLSVLYIIDRLRVDG